MKKSFTLKFKWQNAIIVLTFLCLQLGVKSQTYTTIANGSWTSPATWQGGIVPPSGIIPVTATININHVVNYVGANISNDGNIRIVNTTGLDPQLIVPTNVNFFNNLTGKLFIKDGMYTQYRFVGGGNSGTAQNGYFVNRGGRIEILNSIMEVAQDWENDGGATSFKNGSLIIGGSYYTFSALAIDTLSGVSVSLGWRGFGEFKTFQSFNNFQNAKIQLAGTSGDFFISGPTTLSGSIDYITFKNHVSNIVSGGSIRCQTGNIGTVNLGAYCVVNAVNYDPKGKITGTQTANCALNYFPANYVIVSLAVLSNGLQFTNPSLVSGTNLQVGALYRFNAVSPGIDATVKIDSLVNGAQITTIDDNSATVGYANAFQPAIRSGNIVGRSYAVFTFRFYQSGTSSPFPLHILKTSALDIDGNASLKEFADINMGTGATAMYMSLASDITVTNLAGGAIRGQNVAGIERTGIDTAALANMYTVTNVDVASFTINYGTVTTTATNVARQFSLYLKGFNYNQGILPVKLISFNAVVSANVVTLKWITQNEINHSHYVVERSFDNYNFTNIGLVLDGFDVNGTGKRWELKDNSAELRDRTIAYYRLKQYDVDGKFAYSKILAVRLQPNADVVMQVSPNPFVENVSVRFNATENGNAQIRILNMAGQTMLSKQSIISKGYNNIQVDDLNGLSTGMYIAQLMINGKIIDNQKLVKRN